MFQPSYNKTANGHGNRFRGHRGGNNRFHPRTQPRQSINSSHYVNRAQPQVIEESYSATHQFNDFPIDARLKQNIVQRGYKEPTPIQDQTIPHILAGRDVVGIANTGTGKTAAFLIPLLDKIIRNPSEKILIMVPTRELAVQIGDELFAFSRSLTVRSVLCIGGTSINQQIYTLRNNPNIVIGTPGRLKDLIMRRFINLGLFRNIVLDEVDRMVDIGFIKDITYVISLLPKDRQSLFFSATIPPEVSGIIQAFLRDPITVSVKKKETADHVDQDVIRVKDRNEKLQVLKSMLSTEDYKKVLIFGRTKWGVERLSKTLIQLGITAASIHGNKTQNQRLRALSQFKRGELQVLVATDIAARGLDIEDVTHVINYDEPSTYTDYVHRIGRTGRANKSGKALTFVM